MVDYNGVATTTEHGGEAPARACALLWLTKRSQRASAGAVSHGDEGGEVAVATEWLGTGSADVGH